MMKKIFILFILFSVCFLGGFRLGPFTIRNYASCIIFILLLFRSYLPLQVKNKISHRFIHLYIIYLFVLFVISAFNGDLFDVTGFLNRYTGYYIPCILIFLFIDLFVDSIDELRCIIYFFVTILLINSYVCYLQFFNDPFGWIMGNLLYNGNDSLVTGIVDYLNTYNIETGLGQSVVIGIMSNPVTCGYNVAAFGTFSLVLLYSKKKVFFNRIVFLLLVGLFLLTLYWIQQRLVFYLYLMFIVYILFKYFSYKSWILNYLFLFFIVCCCIYFYEDWNTLQMGRILKVEDENRAELYSAAINYISENFWLGGYNNYMELNKVAPHNFIFNSFIISGFWGALILLYITFNLILKSFSIIIIKSKKIRYSQVFSFSLLIYLITGLTHNSSIATGSIEIFIIYALLLKSLQIEKNEKNNMLH